MSTKNTSYTDDELVRELYSSLLKFTQTFYQIRTGRSFDISFPTGRESHYLTICRGLVNVLRGRTKRLIINVPPRYGKTELVIHFIAWALAQYPDSNFLYVSYSFDLAQKQTATIRNIVALSEYQSTFNVTLSDHTASKSNFETVQGGSVYAAGAGGTITGRGAGVRGVSVRFSGAIIMDDMHKPDEVTSDTMRESVIEWFYNTMSSRTNNADTPMIFIGQRLHESDLAGHLIETGEWELISIPALDEAGNELHPGLHSRAQLLSMQEKSPYVFSAQYQQRPQPAGGGIFKEEWFYLTDEDPRNIIATSITVDTAETDKTYNDATVFSFWGLYKIKNGETETDEYGLHWIDCREMWVSPEQLENVFMEFYRDCCRYPVIPRIVAIEKKSTGVTLSATLKKVRGLTIRDIERTKASGSKTTRYLEMQPYVSSRLISLTKSASHASLCVAHMGKITANNSHARDDIADTAYDAVKINLIDKVILNTAISTYDYSQVAKTLMSHYKMINRLKNTAYRN